MEEAVHHYHHYLGKCKCCPKCDLPGSLQLSRSFAQLNTDERIEKFRSLMLGFVSPPGHQNNLLLFSEPGASSVKACYSLKGYKLCMSAFVPIVQVPTTTLQRHASNGGPQFTIEMYETNRSSGQRGAISVQTKIAVGFLHRYSDIFGLPCPSGQGSSEEHPIRIFPSTTAMADVYDAYAKDWPVILPSAMATASNSREPTAALTMPSFRKVWRERFPALKLSNGASGFCDTCHGFQAALNIVDPTDKLHLERMLAKHKEEADTDYAYYRRTTKECRENPTGNTAHVVFNFAEKVIVPSYHKQPSFLHFLTGLLVDLFGASCSNLQTNFVFALPKGHWPNFKTANEVLSMLQHVINIMKKSHIT